MEKSCTIACVVILYNPRENLLTNIGTYINLVDKLYVVDNSACKSELDFSQHGRYNIHYVFNNQNLGIAAALNLACDMAIEEEFSYILTMDQDSYFEIGTQRLSCLISRPESNIGLYYPLYKVNGYTYTGGYLVNGRMVGVMTSGNILSLSAYKNVGGFEEKLFIDYVDIEMCLKLYSYSYEIIPLLELTLNHTLGSTCYKSFFEKKITVTNHNATRRYYITRNRLYVSHKYIKTVPEFSKVDKRVFANDVLKVIFFEDDKVKKLISIVIGFWHFKIKKFGKYNR